MLITRRNPIPLSWIFMAILPWASIVFQNQVMGTAFTFSLSKFVENPASLTFILSLPGFITIILGPFVSLLSDRVWTRFGRRKPFIVVSGMGSALGLLLMAFSPNAGMLIASYILFCVSADLGGVIEPLKQEIVPPQQRGRATAIMQWLSNLSALLFFTVMLGRFDEVNSIAGVSLTGESAVYASCVVLGVSMLLLLMLAVKEIDPHSPLRGQRITFRTIMGGILDREFLPVYLLVFASAILNAGLGSLGVLLQTVQFGLSKQQMGYNVAIGTTLNLLIFIPLVGLFADRLNRMRAYQALIIIALVIKAIYYVYVEYVLADHRATWQELVVFGEMLSVCAILTQVVFTPLVYDYIRRNKMGTYLAGFSLLMRFTQVITLNGVGLFVWAFSTLYQPPAGEMVRVSMNQERPVQDVREAVAAVWKTPEKTPQIEIWRATGVDLKMGRGVELRQPDKDSARLAEEQKTLASERAKLEMIPQRTMTQESRLTMLKARMAQNDHELNSRAVTFRTQVEQRLGVLLLRDGDQVAGVAFQKAKIITLTLKYRPESRHIERVLQRLRDQYPEVIDLLLTKTKGGFQVHLGVVCEGRSGVAETAWAVLLQRELEVMKPGLVTEEAASQRPAHALRMELIILEEPLNQFVSPINRMLNGILAWFDVAPREDQRLLALGRSLRMIGATEHVRAVIADREKTIAITTFLDDNAPVAACDGAVSSRLKMLLAPLPESAIGQVQAVYNRIVKAAEAQNITVARPVLAAGFVPLKYDYMSGYLWLFGLALIGLGLTFWFCRLEQRQVVSKQGVHEAATEASRAASKMALCDNGAVAPAFHVPGYLWPKLGLMVFGVALLILAVTELWTPVRLMVSGTRAQAEAECVIKQRAGGVEQIYMDDVAARAAEESRDRSWRFTTEFRFATADGPEIRIRLPIKSQLQPIYRLLDEDGLPSCVPVRYDARSPQKVLFPWMFGTWFMPLMVLLFGILNTVTGAVLAWHARRPIELPPPPCNGES